MVPIVKAGITFVMAPVIVHALGNYDYGIWEMVFAVVGYMGMLDLGLSPAIIRNVSRQNALHNTEEVHRIYSSAMAFFLPVGLLLSILLFAGALFPHLIFPNSGDAELQKYSIFLAIVAVQVLTSFVGLVFDTFLEGFQRYSLRNYATIIASVCGALVMYPLLKGGGGILVLAAGNAIGFSLKITFYGFTLAKKKNGGFRFRRRDVSWVTLKELLTFGFKSFIYATSFGIGHFADKLILGAFISPIAVTFYTIPVSLVGQARNLIWSAVRVFMPVFSEMDARNEKTEARKLLFSASRYALAVILPILVGICILGPDFLRYWIGSEYAEQGRLILYIMSAAYLLQWLCPFRNRFLTGLGILDLQARLGVIGVVFNLIISIVLVRYLGKEGVALGTFLPELMIQPYLLWFTCKMAGGTMTNYITSVFVPLLIPFCFFVLWLYWLSVTFPPQSLLQVLLLASISVVFYLPVFVVSGMTRPEKQKILKQVRKIFAPEGPY